MIYDIRKKLEDALGATDYSILADRYHAHTNALLKSVHFINDLPCRCVPNYSCQRCQMLKELEEDLT